MMMMRIPVWVLHSSPWAGLLIQNSFAMIECAHLATINTALPFLWCPAYTRCEAQLRSMCGRE